MWLLQTANGQKKKGIDHWILISPLSRAYVQFGESLQRQCVKMQKTKSDRIVFQSRNGGTPYHPSKQGLESLR